MPTVNSGFTFVAETSGAQTGSKWFASDIDFKALGFNFASGITPFIHIDFGYDVSSIIEITMDGNEFVPINNGEPLLGAVFRSFMIQKGTKFNIQALTNGNLDYATLSIE